VCRCRSLLSLSVNVTSTMGPLYGGAAGALYGGAAGALYGGATGGAVPRGRRPGWVLGPVRYRRPAWTSP
jgi:hypothetical protein